MSFSIGEEIKKKVKERGITNVAFAEKMGIEERNLYHFFKKKDISLEQLLEASHILDHDFIKLYIKNLEKKDKKYSQYVSELTPVYPSPNAPDNQISFSVKIFGEFEKIQHAFPDFIAVMQREAETRGLHLG